MKTFRLLFCTLVLFLTQIYASDESLVDSKDQALEKKNQDKILDDWKENNPKDLAVKRFSSEDDKTEQGPILKGGSSS